MAKKDDLTLLIEALKKREEILQKGQSVSRYNHYFDRMMQYAKQLIEANRQDEILGYNSYWRKMYFGIWDSTINHRNPHRYSFPINTYYP